MVGGRRASSAAQRDHQTHFVHRHEQDCKDISSIQTGILDCLEARGSSVYKFEMLTYAHPGLVVVRINASVPLVLHADWTPARLVLVHEKVVSQGMWLLAAGHLRVFRANVYSWEEQVLPPRCCTGSWFSSAMDRSGTPISSDRLQMPRKLQLRT